MKKIIYIFSAIALAALMSACVDVDTKEVQKVPSPGDELFDDEYYENLREWKESDHILTYVYYAAWAPLEGASSMYKDPTSMAERFIGLPDSLDIVNLWMGVPSSNPDDEYEYSPTAAEDMQYCRETKGTKFVMHVDASNYSHTFTYNGTSYTTTSGDETSLKAYADYYCEQVEYFGIDGLDFDFEGWTEDDLAIVVEECSKYLGPASGTDYLLIVDYFSEKPSEDIEPYIDLLVCQAYSYQIGNSYSVLSNRQPTWCPDEKFVICEQWNQSSDSGSNSDNGGYVPYYGYDGETLYTYNSSGEETEMASLEAYARYCKDGNAGGFGAFYIDQDYYFANGTYYNLRRCIQIACPSIR